MIWVAECIQRVVVAAAAAQTRQGVHAGRQAVVVVVGEDREVHGRIRAQRPVGDVQRRRMRTGRPADARDRR